MVSQHVSAPPFEHPATIPAHLLWSVASTKRSRCLRAGEQKARTGTFGFCKCAINVLALVRVKHRDEQDRTSFLFQFLEEGTASQKAPMLISISDLAEHLDEMRRVAAATYESVNGS